MNRFGYDISAGLKSEIKNINVPDLIRILCSVDFNDIVLNELLDYNYNYNLYVNEHKKFHSNRLQIQDLLEYYIKNGADKFCEKYY